jgi:hypothetical protein
VLNAAGNPVIAYYDDTRSLVGPGARNSPAGNGDLMLMVCGNPACTSGNTVTTVDRGRIFYNEDVGRYASMVLDGKGNPVIVYASKEDGLKLARCGNPTCTSRNSIQVLGSSRVDANISLALDSKGRPVFTIATLMPPAAGSYYGDPDALSLVRCGDPNCTPASSTSTPGTSWFVDNGQYNSLALDKDDNAIISYFEPKHAWLRVARCDAKATRRDACTNVFVDGDPTAKARDLGTIDNWTTRLNAGQYNALRLIPIRDVRGTITKEIPFISYYDATNGDLKAVWCGNATCSSNNFIQTLDAAGDVGRFTAQPRGNARDLAISYVDATNGDLKMAVCDPGESQAITRVLPCQLTRYNTTETVDSAGDVGQYNSIALDSNGKAIISYYDATNHALKVAHQ